MKKILVLSFCAMALLYSNGFDERDYINLTPKEKRMVESVTDKWYNRRGK